MGLADILLRVSRFAAILILAAGCLPAILFAFQVDTGNSPTWTENLAD